MVLSYMEKTRAVKQFTVIAFRNIQIVVQSHKVSPFKLFNRATKIVTLKS
jgi:hypothetical protein